MRSFDDDHPVKITYSDYRPVGSGELEHWLGKEAAGEVQTNEADTTAQYTELYDSPKVDTPGSPADDGMFHGNTTRLADEDRRGFLQRVLNSATSSVQNSKAIMSANFDNVREGNFSAHAVGLQGAGKQSTPSLKDQVRKLLK